MEDFLPEAQQRLDAAKAKYGEGYLATRIDLPAWNKLTVDMEHIASGHIKGGARATGKKDIFGDLNEKQVERVIRGVYEGNTKKLATQTTLNGEERVLIEGTYDGWTVQIWVNKTLKKIETAYPVPGG